MKLNERPLIKHVRDHEVLFSELASVRNAFAQQLGLHGYVYNKIPKLITADGKRLSIEPERSVVLKHYQVAIGLKHILSSQVQGFSCITGSDIGFRYPTAAVAGLSAPFIKRFRSEYFYQTDDNVDICRPVNLSLGIKSRGKADNRQEYEVWIPEESIQADPVPFFVDKYAEDLPEPIREFATEPAIVHGWMGVKRCAFEGFYQNKEKLGDIVLCLALSLDAYNIGARPDLSYSDTCASSIAHGGAEVEWEVMGYFYPKHEVLSNEQIWSTIDCAINALSEPLEHAFEDSLVATNESKTERILSAVAAQGIDDEEIASLNLKPYEFLQTASKSRRKRHDHSRSVNLLGRLNRLFYHHDKPLPSLKELHELVACPA